MVLELLKVLFDSSVLKVFPGIYKEGFGHLGKGFGP